MTTSKGILFLNGISVLSRVSRASSRFLKMMHHLILLLLLQFIVFVLFVRGDECARHGTPARSAPHAT